MKIALTGATGFIGRYIVRHLVSAGLLLRCWYRPSSDRSGLESVAGSVEWLKGDLLRGKRLQKLRSEYLERSFAHVCETGGARRTFLQLIENVRKQYLIATAAQNLGCLMRSLFKMGTPRGLQTFQTDLDGVVSSLRLAWLATAQRWKLRRPLGNLPAAHQSRAPPTPAMCSSPEKHAYFDGLLDLSDGN